MGINGYLLPKFFYFISSISFSQLCLSLSLSISHICHLSLLLTQFTSLFSLSILFSLSLTHTQQNTLFFLPLICQNRVRNEGKFLTFVLFLFPIILSLNLSLFPLDFHSFGVRRRRRRRGKEGGEDQEEGKLFGILVFGVTPLGGRQQPPRTLPEELVYHSSGAR